MSTVFLGTIDGGGDGKTLLLAALNAKLKTNYRIEDFDFGTPEVVQVVQPTRNTKIRLGPKMSSGYYGVRTIFYNRIHASELGKIIVPYAGEPFLSGLLPQINEKYGIQILPEDIIDRPIAAPTTSNQVEVQLEFNPNSIIYYSSTFIQVGQNDPTGDTAPTMPFMNSATFVFDSSTTFTLGEQKQVLLEPYSLAIGTDNERKHTSSLAPALRGTGVAAHARTRLPEALFNKTRKYLPFVGQWRHPLSGKSVGVTVVGDVYELSGDGFDWVFVRNGLGLSEGSPTVATDAYNSPNVKCAAQAADGSVYVLARKPGEAPAVWKISNTDALWTKQNYSATRMQSLTPALWDRVEVLDCLHNNNRLWMLIRSDASYDIHPTKGALTPSVEMVNTNTQATDYFPLGELRMRFSNIQVDTTNGRWRLVTPVSDATSVDVIALLPSTINDNIYGVMYRHQAGSEYLGYFLPHTTISNTAAVREQLDICGYQLPLKKLPAKQGATDVVGHFLEVIQIISPVEVDTFGGYFLRTNQRTTQKYLGYGVRTLTSVATRTARTPWRETQSQLRSINAPVFVTLNGQEGRNHVMFQNGNAMHRTTLRQIPDTAEFEAVIDSLAKLETHTGFEGVSKIGSCIYVAPALSEGTQPAAQLATIQDDEAALPPIGFSFIARDAASKPVWYTAQNAGELLTLRKPSPNYAFLGTTPALTAAEGNNILYISREGNGIFISTNRGASWGEYNSAPAFYNQESAPSAARNIIGSAVLQLTSNNFGEGAYANGKFLLDVRAQENLKLYDINAGSQDAEAVVPDQMLYTVRPGQSGNHYVSSGEQAGFGFNALSQFSPRQILAWDSDAESTYETIGKYTSNPAAPYAQEWRIQEYMYQTPGTLVDFSRDIKYLGWRHFILTQDNDVWSLGFVTTVVPDMRIGLYGSANSPYNTLKPEVNFHLWDYYDNAAEYIPYVFYGDKKVLLLERIGSTGDMGIVSQHLIGIPGDNGNPLQTVKMYTANRRDYWFFQKGNGLFSLRYSWDGIGETSVVDMVRRFDLSSPALKDLEVVSGCIVGIAAANAPMEGVLPDKLPADTFIGQQCQGTTMVKRYADGNGSYYETSTPNSVDCGFVADIGVLPNQTGTTGTGGTGS